MDGEPTATLELRRGLSAYNLAVGAASAGAAGLVTLLATGLGLVPDVTRAGALGQALVTAVFLFVTITALHTGAHTYFGWRFGRGVRAARAGQHRRAVRLLAPVERRGMSHYDPAGHAQRALVASRAAVSRVAG